ncbi:unnamed protein product, partial [Rotaria magnacalcarata]
RFQITQQGDPVEFLAWFLNSLHLTLNGTKKSNSSIVYKAFQGKMKIYTRKIPPIDLSEDEKRKLLAIEEYREYDEETPYLFLSVDLPPPPLFRDEFKESIIPQVPLFQILTKFDGQTAQEHKTYKDNFLKRYEIRKLPPYLILCFRVKLPIYIEFLN